jgi:Holliday junction resolvasome RuvABC endonuclease subunit
MQTSLRLAELGGAVRFMLYRRGIPFVVIGPTALKFFATGNGNASKQQMVDAARALGAEVANDNEADAWWLWLAAQQRYEPHLERPVLTALLNDLPWPELKHAAA